VKAVLHFAWRRDFVGGSVKPRSVSLFRNKLRCDEGMSTSYLASSSSLAFFSSFLARLFSATTLSASASSSSNARAAIAVGPVITYNASSSSSDESGGVGWDVIGMRPSLLWISLTSSSFRSNVWSRSGTSTSGIVPRNSKALKLAENVSLIAEEVWDQGGL